MSVLIDETTRLVIQGMTGRLGRFFASDLRKYGTRVVAGVSPGHAGEDVDGVPIFDFVADAVAATQANTSLVMVPGHFAKDAIFESANAGVRLIVCVSDPVPQLDMLHLKWFLQDSSVKLVGPNTTGVISPGKCKVGFMPSQNYRPGNVGIVSKSGSLSYEVALRLSSAGCGQSTVIGIGGDPIKGLDMIEAVQLLEADPETRVIFLVTEIGVNDEAAVVEALERGKITKPLLAFMVGRVAPRGKKLGHAGALIGSDREAYEPKLKMLNQAGITVISSLGDIGKSVERALQLETVR